MQDEVLIELGLQEQLDAVDTPARWTWETSRQEQQILPPGTKVIDKFESLGSDCSLLILGDPASGKTITLLKLASDLIERARGDVSLPMPVVLNLSSWKGQTLDDWLVEELNNKYEIPRKIGKDWVSKDQLLLLLDGLDEVRYNRIGCVQALNQFINNHRHTKIVVCSRIKQYKALNRALNFSAAIRLLPLTQEEIHNYLDELDKLGSQGLAKVRTALINDTQLQELAKSPLMLNIIILVYKSSPDVTTPLPKKTTLSLNPITVVFNLIKSLKESIFGQSNADDLTPEPGQALANQEELRQRLFNEYIRLMVLRHSIKEENDKQWLIWLAKRMKENSQTVFSIEDMQPSWFQKDSQQRRVYHFAVMLIVRLLSGLSGGLIASLFNYSPQPINSSLVYICMGAIAGLISGVISELFTQFNFGVINKWKHRRHDVIDFSGIFGRIFRQISEIFTRLNLDVVSRLLTGLSSEVEALNFKLSFELILIFELFICIASLYLTSFLFSETTITPILETPLFVFIVLFITQRTDIENIRPTDSINLSFSEAKKKFFIGMILGIFSGIILLITGMIVTFNNPSFTIKNVWFNEFLYQTAKMLYIKRFNLEIIIKILSGLLMLGFFVGLWVGLVLGVEKKDFVEKGNKITNQGIWNSVINSINLITVGGLIGALISVVVWIFFHMYPGIIWWVHYGNDPFSDGLIFSLVVGSIIGLINGLIGGDNSGLVCIKHFVLRVILCRSGNIPWDYARFLDYATERILLQKVSGSYIFIHRLLLEHFARMPSADQSASE
ncbi:MAG: NACHT domain-containing protein [Nostoc sp.]